MDGNHNSIGVNCVARRECDSSKFLVIKFEKSLEGSPLSRRRFRNPNNHNDFKNTSGEQVVETYNCA